MPSCWPPTAPIAGSGTIRATNRTPRPVKPTTKTMTKMRTTSSEPELEHDPEKWAPVFRKACPRARPEGSCSSKKPERDDDSKKNHHALGEPAVPRMGRLFRG